MADTLSRKDDTSRRGSLIRGQTTRGGVPNRGHCTAIFGSVKEYIEAFLSLGCPFPLPDRCPHPDCQASGWLIRWGTYERGALTGDVDHRLRIQRVRCKVCGRTHSLLPDFLHPYRHYVISLLQQVVSLYLLAGLGWRRLMRQCGRSMPGTCPLHGAGVGRLLRLRCGSPAASTACSATCWPLIPVSSCPASRQRISTASPSQRSAGAWKTRTPSGSWPSSSMPRSRLACRIFTSPPINCSLSGPLAAKPVPSTPFVLVPVLPTTPNPALLDRFHPPVP